MVPLSSTSTRRFSAKVCEHGRGANEEGYFHVKTSMVGGQIDHCHVNDEFDLSSIPFPDQVLESFGHREQSQDSGDGKSFKVIYHDISVFIPCP